MRALALLLLLPGLALAQGYSASGTAASATSSGNVTTGTQTFAGAKTFSSTATFSSGLASSGSIVTSDLVYNSVSPVNVFGNQTNGASAIGIRIGSGQTFSTSGAKLVSIATTMFAGTNTEKAYVSKDGDYVSTGGGFGLSALPGTTGISLSGSNVVYRDGGGAHLFQGTGGSGYTATINVNGLAFNVGTQKLAFTATDSSASPGNAVVNKPSGQAAFAALASAVTISNTDVSATSICFGIMQQTDASCTEVISGIVSSNSVTFNANAACTGITKFGWLCFD